MPKGMFLPRYTNSDKLICFCPLASFGLVEVPLCTCPQDCVSFAIFKQHSTALSKISVLKIIIS